MTFVQQHPMFSIFTHAVMAFEGKIVLREEENDALETRTLNNF